MMQRFVRPFPPADAAPPNDNDSAGPREFAPIPNEGPAPGRPSLAFYGEEVPEPPPWLIKSLLPQGQVAVAAGQYSSGKTFVALDLSYSAMTGRPFVDCDVVRTGGVLWLAAEGRSEVMVRVKAAALHATGHEQTGDLPFAVQVGSVPRLTDPEALSQLLSLAALAREGLANRFDVELVLIVIDTLNSAAGFQDENSASEAQRVFNVLRALSAASGALVLVVDHYGKTVETGVRGSSAKGGAADAILAVLADKGADGKISNRRLVVEKLRQAETGRTISFSLIPVQVDDVGNTSAAVSWAAGAVSAKVTQPAKPAWSGGAKVLKAAIECAMLEHGYVTMPFGAEGPALKAVPFERVRAEFYLSYAAETQEAKRQQFKRLVAAATNAGLIATRQVGEVDLVWFVSSDPST